MVSIQLNSNSNKLMNGKDDDENVFLTFPIPCPFCYSRTYFIQKSSLGLFNKWIFNGYMNNYYSWRVLSSF